MFNLIIVFVFTILLICCWIKIIDLIFIYQQKIKISFIGLNFTKLSVGLLFLSTSIIFLLCVNLILNLSQFSNVPENSEAERINIAIEDCSLLLNTIAKTENKSSRQEDHRYIEKEAPLFTLKLDYQKGAQQLREQARQYTNLKFQKSTAESANKIARKLQEKATLFEQRITIKENEVSKKEIYQLLDRMDRITEERQQLIELVKQKCTETDT